MVNLVEKSYGRDVLAFRFCNTSTVIMSFKYILDDILRKQGSELSATKVRVLNFVQDDQSFDTAFDSLLQKSADRKSINQVKQTLNPCIEKTKTFMNALQNSTNDGVYTTLLFRTIFAALEVRGLNSRN